MLKAIAAKLKIMVHDVVHAVFCNIQRVQKKWALKNMVLY